MMFCVNCKEEMKDSKTNMQVPGKESTIEVVNVPSSICPKCDAQVVDGITTALVHKSAKKVKKATLDFDKMSGIGLMAGKI
ncbi:hypothetical protein IGI39_001462 [Enterococcus sp. AZ135]|uniref:YgiT-type zinc finger protein n=1 Tax=unclassified Enterococcus TaxID=2608891 RepID=UPI003F1F240D